MAKSLQSGADGEHDVGLGGEPVGTFASDDTDRTGVARVVPRQCRLAGDGLDDGDAVALGERGQLGFGERVVHSAAGDDERRSAVAQRGDGGGDLAPVGPRPADAGHDRLEERVREVVAPRPARPAGGR